MVYFLILRPLKKQALAAFRELAGKVGMAAKALTAAEANTIDAADVSGGEQNKRAGQLKRQLSEKIRTDPTATSRLVQTWVREPQTK